MKLSKILCLLLALSMLLVCFAACNNDENKTNESEETTDKEEETLDPNSAFVRSGLEVRDYTGKEFTVWYSTYSSWAPYPLQVSDEEGNSGDIVYSAGYKRNDELENLLGCILTYVPSESDGNLQDSAPAKDTDVLRNLQLGGDLTSYDMVMSGAQTVAVLAQEGFYYDLNQSPYIKTTEDYYEAQVNEQVEVKGKQYFASGFYSVMNTAAIDITWVNADIIQNTNGLTKNDLYDLALDNKWTISKLLELGSAYATPDSNTGDYNSDHYALLLSFNYCLNIYFDLGGTVVDYNKESDSYAVTVRDSANIDLLTWIQNNITKSDNVLFSKNDQHYNAFFAESAPFLCCTFFGIWQFLDSDISWATLPAPLMNEGDEYRAYSDNWNLNFAGIPSICADTDKAGYFYELFMCLSYDYVYPAYYETCFGTRYQPDEVGSQVFDIVAHSRYIDLADIYGLYSSMTIANIVRSSTTGVSSATKTIQSEVKGGLNSLLNKFS